MNILKVKNFLEDIFIRNDRCNDNVYGCLYILRLMLYFIQISAHFRKA